MVVKTALGCASKRRKGNPMTHNDDAPKLSPSDCFSPQSSSTSRVKVAPLSAMHSSNLSGAGCSTAMARFEPHRDQSGDLSEESQRSRF